MDDDGVLAELRGVVLVQPVVVLGEITLLGDPKLDGIVLSSYEDQTDTTEECEH